MAAARDGGQAIVAGDVVNTASRLQSVAPPGGVLVCGTTYALTSTAIRYDAQPPVTLRGRSSPDRGVAGPGAGARSTPDREPDATPLVGRDHELGLLVNALHRTAARAHPAAGHRARPGRHRQEPAGPRAVPARRAAGRRAVCLAHRALPAVRGERRPTPRWPTSSRPQAGILDTDTAETARERLDAAAGRPGRHPAGGRPARRRAAPAGRPARPQAARRGGRVGLAAVPGRAGRAPADRAGLRGPALGRRGDAALHRAARRRPCATCRCCCSAPPGRSWSTGTRAGPGTIAGSRRPSRCRRCATPASPRSTRTCSAQAAFPPTCSARWSSSPTATRSTPRSTSGC